MNGSLALAIRRFGLCCIGVVAAVGAAAALDATAYPGLADPVWPLIGAAFETDPTALIAALVTVAICGIAAMLVARLFGPKRGKHPLDRGAADWRRHGDG